MSEYIEFAVRVPKDEADYFIARFGKGNVRILGFLLGEEIVRCRDCAYNIHFFHHDDERWQCTEPHQEGNDVKPDGYCWRGERKECNE